MDGRGKHSLVDSKDDVFINVADEEDDASSDSGTSIEIVKERPAWDNKFQYIMAALGFAVGLGNIWRFPYLCHKNGGGAFLIPYFIMLFLMGYPLYYLELAVGQKIRKGAIGVWCSISPKFAGVGFASIVVSLLIGLYYNVILSWALFYLFHSFRSTLPWSACPTDNGTVIEECAKSGPTSYFWYRKTLNISSSFDTGSDINLHMLLALFIAWLLVFLGIMKGIKSSGKVMYFMTAFPYIVLIAFFIRGMTLDGAAQGVAYMFKPNLSKLLDATVWREAATQIFFSLGLGYGAIIAYSSYNAVDNNCEKDAKFVATANSLTSVFACITVFSILGHRAHMNIVECDKQNRLVLQTQFPDLNFEENHTHEALQYLMINLNESFPVEFDVIATDIKNCSMEKELKTIGQGTGLAFIAFAEAIISFPGAPFWSCIFFLMLFCIGMSSEFGILQSFMTTVLDSNLNISKTKLSATLCLSMYLIGIIFTMRSGSYILDVFDSYSATLALVAIAFFETVAISWQYGLDRFVDDIEKMIGSKPGLYWKISWKFTCPLIMFVIFAASLVELFLNKPLYYPWVMEDGAKAEKGVPYPGYIMLLIVVLVMSSLICLPLFFALTHFKVISINKFIGEEDNKGEDVTESKQPLAQTSI